MESMRRTEVYEQTLATAEQIARDRGDGYVGVEHLMLAILADANSMPTFEMQYRMGIDVGDLARRVALFLDTPPPEPDAQRARFLDGRVVDHYLDGRVITRYPDGRIDERHEPPSE
ncbi:Clp protease N-terminal domain-containing protein [Nocardia sp. NPDC052566]|uniref:Clp protease N-terminal domain-containing protein n=1 Tax=Nocardia sp. NPDC052566 TaxID=3364330 RepID=UPI0037CC0B09